MNSDLDRVLEMQREYAAEYAAAPEGRKAGPMLGIADCVMEVLSQAIPPAYGEFVARRASELLR